MSTDDPTEPTTQTRRRPHPYELVRRRLGGIQLRVLSGPGASDRVKRFRKRVVTGGRSHMADLQLHDESLSAVHFELRLEGEHIWLEDLGSTNGTWLGDHRVGRVGLPPGAAFMAEGCEIQLVGAELVDVPISTAERFGQMFGRSEVMREVFASLERLAAAGLDVVLQGETGTGKDLAARALHEHSLRRDGPFVVLDCAALTPSLANATLFGHARGAFTDAREERPGCFEEADGGTLFIDELGELPLDLQPKLLRALDRREIVRVGESRPRKVDVRVIAATHRDLQRMVAEGHFRDDLYFRLSQIVIPLPALRDREDDVVFLADRFAAEFGGPGWRLSPEIQARLREHRWPGNVRELRRAIQAAVAMGSEDSLIPGRLALGTVGGLPTLAELRTLPWREALEVFERFYLKALLRETEGNLSEAERRCGVTRKVLREKMQRLGLRG